MTEAQEFIEKLKQDPPLFEAVEAEMARSYLRKAGSKGGKKGGQAWIKNPELARTAGLKGVEARRRKKAENDTTR